MITNAQSSFWFACWILLPFFFFNSSLSQAKDLWVENVCLLKALRKKKKKKEAKTYSKHNDVQHLPTSVQEQAEPGMDPFILP